MSEGVPRPPDEAERRRVGGKGRKSKTGRKPLDAIQDGSRGGERSRTTGECPAEICINNFRADFYRISPSTIFA